MKQLNFHFQHIPVVKNLKNHNPFTTLKSIKLNSFSFVKLLGLNRLKYTAPPILYT